MTEVLVNTVYHHQHQSQGLDLLSCSVPLRDGLIFAM